MNAFYYIQFPEGFPMFSKEQFAIVPQSTLDELMARCAQLSTKERDALIDRVTDDLYSKSDVLLYAGDLLALWALHRSSGVQFSCELVATSERTREIRARHEKLILVADNADSRALSIVKS